MNRIDTETTPQAPDGARPAGDDLAARLLALRELVARKSEANKFKAVKSGKLIMAEATARLEAAPATLGPVALVTAAELAVSLRNWRAAVTLWEAVGARMPDNADRAHTFCAAAHLALGDLDAAERHFAAVSPALRSKPYFSKKYAEYQRARARSFTRGLEAVMRNDAAAHPPAASAHAAALLLALRGVPDAIVGAVPALVRSLSPAADTTAAAEAGIAAPAPVADFSQFVFVAGFGWSGSGAVFDYLRQSPDTVTPTVQRELSVFEGVPGSVNSLAALIRSLADGAQDGAEHVRSIVLQDILGLALREVEEAGWDSYVFNKSLAALFAAPERDPTAFARVLGGLAGDLAPLIAQARHDLVPQAVARMVAVAFAPMVPAGRIALFNNAIHARNVAVLDCLPGARMIAVTRDPRDQFVSRSLEAKARDTKGVGRFIKASRVTLEAFRGDVARFGLSDRVTEVTFEDFVADPALRRATAKGLGLDPARLVEERHFVAAESARNIGIHRGHARQAVIRKIERELMAAATGEAPGGGVTPRP